MYLMIKYYRKRLMEAEIEDINNGTKVKKHLTTFGQGGADVETEKNLEIKMN